MSQPKKKDLLLPSQWYHNKLMQAIDDAYWIGENDTGKFLQQEADFIKEHYISKGESWYPNF